MTVRETGTSRLMLMILLLMILLLLLFVTLLRRMASLLLLYVRYRGWGRFTDKYRQAKKRRGATKWVLTEEEHLCKQTKLNKVVGNKLIFFLAVVTAFLYYLFYYVFGRYLFKNIAQGRLIIRHQIINLSFPCRIQVYI